MDSSSRDGSSWMQTVQKLEQRDVFGKDSLTNTLFSKTGSAVCISHKADRSWSLAPPLESLFCVAESHLKFPHLKPHMTQLIHLPGKK